MNIKLKIANLLYEFADYLMVKTNIPWFTITADTEENVYTDDETIKLPIVTKWNDSLLKTLKEMGYTGNTEQELINNFLSSLIIVDKKHKGDEEE